LVVTVACFVGPGCDDTRPVVDDPVGGVGNAGGEPAASGGAEDPGTAGSGAAAGQGGAAPVSECPADLFEAEGQDCSDFAEGFICSDGGTDPCEFGNSIVCTDGAWERQEAFPAPCGGAGGQASGGAPAAGGAGGQGGAG
jgi:hypothetical protein